MISFNGYCLCINPVNKWDQVCCVVEVNFLILWLFSSPATAPKPQLTTSTTSAPTASPITINTHMWHSLTSHVIELPTKVKATETHAVTVSNTLPGSTDQNTEVPSNVSDDPTSGWENKDPIADEALIGIISASVFILLVLILVVLFCRWRKGYVWVACCVVFLNLSEGSSMAEWLAFLTWLCQVPGWHSSGGLLHSQLVYLFLAWILNQCWLNFSCLVWYYLSEIGSRVVRAPLERYVCRHGHRHIGRGVHKLQMMWIGYFLPF